MTELVDKDIKIVIIIRYHIDKKIGKYWEY